ncbi:MAG: rRNA maturation RNase YbeY [Flavobacteriaceae bacterium]|nr:rRNA maturation RNase YbeY [Flavobacteriaceae bacterium]MDG2415621.1 rRNA maturation RNase YbeY [Flavobacteriaceae bacterium]
MIDFNFIDVAPIENDRPFMDWLSRVAESEGYSLSALSYIFCNDQYLLDLNQTYLSHDTLTDIITFDYVAGTVVSGDIFISVDRLKENAAIFKVSFEEERLRVMAHGLLHLMGYKDKTAEDQEIMSNKENEKIKMFHVEQ